MATCLLTRARPAALAVLVTWCGVACGGATRPGEQVRSLAIVPDRNSLYVGESSQFRAVAQFADGRTEDIPANWAVSGGQLRLGLPGEVTGTLTGVAVLSASGLGLSATRSVEVVDDLRGTWSGIARTETCNRIIGSGPAYCARSNGQNKRTEFTVVEQAGGALALSMTIETTVGSVTASLDSLGAFQPIGMPDLAANLESGPYHRRLMDWKMELRGTGSARELIGSCLMEYDMYNAFGRNVYRDTYTMSLTKQ